MRTARTARGWPGLHQLRQLGDAVGGVGLLRVALPERVFLEGHRRVLGVGADRAEHHGLGGARLPRGIEHECAHQQVVEVQVRRSLAVGAYPPTLAARWITRSGRRSAKHRLGGGAVPQVDLGGTRSGAPGAGASSASRAVTAEPRKPPAPVTRTCLSLQNALIALHDTATPQTRRMGQQGRRPRAGPFPCENRLACPQPPGSP